MSNDFDSLLSELKKTAKPTLDRRADALRKQFMDNVDEFVDASRADVLDDLLKKASKYKVEAITEDDEAKAEQYSEAADTVLRQIRVILVAEKVVAEKAVASMIEQAAITVWEGFKSVASELLSVAVKGLASSFLGSGGGSVTDRAGDMLEDFVD